MHLHNLQLKILTFCCLPEWYRRGLLQLTMLFGNAGLHNLLIKINNLEQEILSLKTLV